MKILTLGDSSQDNSSRNVLTQQETWIRKHLYKTKTNSMLMTHHNRKYAINEDFFKKSSESTYYCLGFIVADGCLVEGRKIQINIVDKDILEKIRKAMDSEHPIKYAKQSKNTLGDFYYRLSIGSVKMYKDLEKLGVHPRKTSTQGIIDVPNNMFKHFFRGVFDGDGGVYDVQNRTIVEIIGTKEFLTWISAMINKLLGLRLKTCHKQIGVYKIKYATREARKLLDWIYNDATIYGERKWKKYMKLKEKGYWNRRQYRRDKVKK